MWLVSAHVPLYNPYTIPVEFQNRPYTSVHKPCTSLCSPYGFCICTYTVCFHQNSPAFPRAEDMDHLNHTSAAVLEGHRSVVKEPLKSIFIRVCVTSPNYHSYYFSVFFSAVSGQYRRFVIGACHARRSMKRGGKLKKACRT